MEGSRRCLRGIVTKSPWSAGGRPYKRGEERVAAGEGELTRDVVEPPAADACRLRRAGDDDAQADGVRIDGEGAVAPGPGRVGPLEPDVELGRLTAQGEADPATGCFRDQVDRPLAARGVAANERQADQHAPRWDDRPGIE